MIPKTILFMGDSITAGYGIDVEQAFPRLIEEKLKSNNLPHKVINAGLSGETSAGGVRRIDWLLKNKIDIFVLELGANDALRGLDLNVAGENLVEIIKKAKDKYPSMLCFLAGMRAPPNLGDKYSNHFEKMYVEVSQKAGCKLIPFILENVAGIEGLNQSDGIHPTEEGQKIIAENVWEVLRPVLLGE